MRRLKSALPLAAPPLAVLALAVLLLPYLAVPAQAQCMIQSTMTNTFGGTKVISKILSAADNCSATMTSAANCAPSIGSGAIFTMTLAASANTTSINPACTWNCDCGTVTIDSSDGLPVELMNFEVEDEPEDKESPS